MKNFIICTLLLFFVACSTPRNNITIASTKDINVKDINLNNLTKREIETEVCNGCAQTIWALLYLSPGEYPNLDKAISQALMVGNGDLLLDAFVFSRPSLVPFVCCTKVKGTVVNTKEAK